MKYPLEDFRILDFGTAWAGPQVGQILADLGAEVIKIESRKKLDGARMGRPIVVDDISGGDSGKWPDMQPVFHGLNRNKLSFTVDLKNPKGLEMVKRLVKISDVVLDNFSPGTMQRLGLDHQSLAEIKPDIITISLTGSGESGNLRDVILYAPSIIALGGLASLIGYYNEDKPLQIMSPFGNANASIHGAFATLITLWHREMTGEGQHIELSESEAVLSLLGEAIMEYSMNRRDMKPQGNYHPHMSPHGIYPCKGRDKWIAIAINTDDEWYNFCKAIGCNEWILDPRFKSRNHRLAHHLELDSLIANITTGYEAYELIEILQKVNVAATPVMNIEDQYVDPHFRERKTFIEIEHPLIGIELLPGVPFRLSRTSGSIRRYAPSLGEHNNYILGKLLKLSKNEIDKLIEMGVIY